METELGKVVHFFNKIQVAVIALNDRLKNGDVLHFVDESKGIDFTQSAQSIQLDHKEVDKAEAGTEIAVKVEMPADKGTTVYKSS